MKNVFLTLVLRFWPLIGCLSILLYVVPNHFLIKMLLPPSLYLFWSGHVTRAIWIRSSAKVAVCEMLQVEYLKHGVLIAGLFNESVCFCFPSSWTYIFIPLMSFMLPSSPCLRRLFIYY